MSFSFNHSISKCNCNEMSIIGLAFVFCASFSLSPISLDISFHTLNVWKKCYQKRINPSQRYRQRMSEDMRYSLWIWIFLLFITSIMYMQSSVNINSTTLSSTFDIHLQINNYFTDLRR